MTLTRKQHSARGVGRPRKDEDRKRMILDMAEMLQELASGARNITFPSPKYLLDPVGFARDVVGIKTWSRQREILEAVRDHDRVAVVSGHKIGKSTTAALIALWWYCSHQNARAVMTSTTSRQVDEILWRELRMQRARSGRCLACKAEDPTGLRITRPCPHSAIIDGDEGMLARTGLRSVDFREIYGFTAREPEAVAGISGTKLLFILDEASGIPDIIFEAIEGNRAGGAKIVMFSNGTQSRGTFYDAFHASGRFWHTMRVSSEESPNITGEDSIPGLATAEWVEEKREEWGADSPLFKVRVSGGFADLEEAKIFSIEMIEEAERRWSETQPAGRLFVGLDPAGEGDKRSDETAMCARRGMKVLQLTTWRGLTRDATLAHLLGVLDDLRIPGEIPVVCLDAEGSVGANYDGMMRDYAERNPSAFEIISVRASKRIMTKPAIYDRVRDKLIGNLEAWFRAGGAIPEDTKLEHELNMMEWELDPTNGLQKVTAKSSMRAALNRSPDRMDSLALSVWEHGVMDERDIVAEVSAHHQPAPTPQLSAIEAEDRALTERGGAMDPYADRDYWDRMR